VSDHLVAGDSPRIKGVWSLNWDETYFYLMVVVTDPVLTQTHANNTFQLDEGDGAHFEIGTATPVNGNTQLEDGDKQVLLGVDNGRLLSATHVASGSAFVDGLGAIPGLQGVSAPHPGGYLIQAKVPWAALGISNPKAGSQIGMNLNISDAIPDGPRKGELRDMVSNNPNGKANDPHYRDGWGTLALKG
jgi:hypothetical protein